MLVEVQCDKFISYGKVREPIRFKAGPNTVINDENGSNSVGKATFLMILDFVFGGKDYVNKCLDVQENVGEHCINFTFEFDGELYHFSRSNIDYKHVIRCDKDYNPLSEDSQMTVDDIAFDRLDTYDAETKKTMMGHCALELSPDGNELFGRAWNKETESENGGAEN